MSGVAFLLSPEKEMLLRSASINDLSAISQIEHESFSPSWTAATFQAELENPQARFLIAEQENMLLGYVCSWLVVDEIQILRVAVRPDARRDGVASRLVYELLGKVRREGATFASLEVRKDNSPARRLYSQLGFSERAIRPDYYDDGEDALFLVKDLTE